MGTHGQKQWRQAAAENGSAHAGVSLLKGLTSKVLQLSASPLYTSRGKMAWASQKEHGGRGKACMRALRGGKRVVLNASPCLHTWSCIHKVPVLLFSMKKLVMYMLSHEGLE
eukprot:scaffold156308_cov14-Tisochrysis_lutea.AAC.1